MSTPKFASRADQLDYVFRKFAGFMGVLFTRAGLEDVPIEMITEAPFLLIMGRAMDIKKKYGEGLLKHDMEVVRKMIEDQLESMHILEERMSSAELFLTHLEENPEDKDKFFLYTRIITELLE